jgi:hypothetical protein
VGAIPEFRDIAVGLPFQLNARVTDNGPGNDDVDATLVLGKATARVTGSIGGAGDFSGSAFQVAVGTPDANQLAKALGITAPAGTPLKARVASSITAERINFEAWRVSVADAELVGSAWVDHKSDQRMLGFQGKAKGTDLARIIGPLLPAGARSALPRLPFAASVELRLTPGILAVTSFNASVGESDLKFSGRLVGGKRGAGLSGALSARNNVAHGRLVSVRIEISHIAGFGRELAPQQ